MALNADNLISRLRQLQTGLLTLGRFTALDALATAKIDGKLHLARQVYTLVDSAHQLSDFLLRFYQVKSEAVQWPTAHRPLLLDDGTVDRVRLDRDVRSLSSWAARTIKAIEADSTQDVLLSPVQLMLRPLQAAVPQSAATGDACNLNPQNALSKPVRAFFAPQTSPIDPVFKSTYSLTERPEPSFSDDLKELVPYFWTLAMSEAITSDLCFLNSVEYDGLPIAFHRDMAKQAWDEIRHARFYLSCSIDLFPEVESDLAGDSDLAVAIRTFKSTGTGLSVPVERHLSEALWNASLAERLILIQYRTEAPTVQRLTKKLRSNVCSRYPHIAHGLEIDRYDEKSHAQIGLNWLKHLIPDPSERKAAIHAADGVRPVLLLTAFARHGGESLGSLVTRYSSGEKLP